MTLIIELPLAVFFIPADYGLNITCNYMGGLEPCVAIRGKNIEVDIYLKNIPIDDYEAHKAEMTKRLIHVKYVIARSIAIMLEDKENITLTAESFDKEILSTRYID